MADVLKVRADSVPKKVAGALAAIIREEGTAEVQAVGAGAVNQAVKAIAVARGYVAQNGFDLMCAPGFTDLKIDDADRTAIKFVVYKR